ncbi:glycosyltransferase family 9 protein [uncultured Croceitalea sp.]|uniref:glycosyltransferase family 9 protein n=1 Tax=uncultured Croceitalea sp. TaxID=1798908 RepID=UPI00374E4159
MDKNKQGHILIIRLSAMGDVAMTVPVLLSLTNSYPNLKVTVLTRAFFKPLFSQMENVTVSVVDVNEKHKGILGLYRLFKELKPLKFDAVADLHNVLRSNILKVFFRVTGIPFVQIDKGRREKKALTRTKNKSFKQLKTTHERYADVFTKLGFLVDLVEVKLLEREELSTDITRVTGDKNHKWIGIAPFAAHNGKMYPLNSMKEVILRLAKEKTNKILLFGGGTKEASLLNEIESNHESKVVNCAGKLSFKEELALISNLNVMLSMDSGNGHLATNYGIPVVTLWGVTHPYAGFAPFGQPEENGLTSDIEKYPMIPTSIYGNKVPQGYEKVMETISPKKVAQKIVTIINNKG